MENFAINTAIFDGHDIETSLKAIKSLGIEYVEFAYNQGYVGKLDASMFSKSHAEHLLSLLEQEGLKTIALGCTMNLASENAVEEFKMRIDFAQHLGVTYLNACTGPAAERTTIVSNLKELAAYAEDKGCVICIENGGDHNFSAFATANDGIDIITEVNSPALALNFDPGNSVSLVPELDPAEEALIALPYCRHFHIKDVKIHDDRFTFPTLGEGTINYASIFPKLVSRKLPFSIEKPLRMYRRKDALPVRGDKPESMETILRVLTESIAHIRQLAGS